VARDAEHAPEGPPPRPPRPSWRREWWILLGLLGLAAVGLVLWLGLRDSDGSASAIGTATVPTESQEEGHEGVQMSDLRGQPYRGGITLITGLGLIADTVPVASREPRGTIVAQEPPPGTPASPDEPVTLKISLGQGPRGTTPVPDLTGPGTVDALRSCAEEDVTCRIEFRPAPEPDNVGEVIDQDPTAGTTVLTLSQVTLFVGR